VARRIEMKRRVVTRVRWSKFYQWLGNLPTEFQEPLKEGQTYHPWPAQVTSLEATGIGDKGYIMIRVANEPFAINHFSMERIMEKLKVVLQIPGLIASIMSKNDGFINISFQVPPKGFCNETIRLVVSILIGFGCRKYCAPEITQETQIFIENNDPNEIQVGEWVPYGKYLMDRHLHSLGLQ
jgi:hypothetical protein